MRQISLILIIGTILLSGCDARTAKARQAEMGSSSYQSEQVTTIDDNGNTFTRDEVVNERDPLATDDNLIQAEEARDEDRKTFNEKQFSDDEADYPLDKNTKGETFNEDQLTP